MIGLTIFIVIAMAGCAFLIYFTFALWRDSRNSSRRRQVEIRKLRSPRKDKGELLYLHSVEEFDARVQKRR